MAVLKKLKASTLMETLVATVLIVVVFMLSSMLMNSLFANTLGQNDQSIKQELLLLQYKLEHDRLQMPYYDEMDDWQIDAFLEGEHVVFSAVNTESQQEIRHEVAHE